MYIVKHYIVLTCHGIGECLRHCNSLCNRSLPANLQAMTSGYGKTTRATGGEDWEFGGDSGGGQWAVRVEGG